MINKSASIFPLYLVLLTLALCTTSILFYYSQQEVIANSLVSAVPVLKLEDNLGMFEIHEKYYISFSAYEVWQESGEPIESIGSEQVKERFCDSFSLGKLEYAYSPWIFYDACFEGVCNLQELVKYDNPRITENKKEFCNKLYEFDIRNNILTVQRKEIKKSFKLIAERDKKNFPVDVSFSFSKNYEFPLKEVEVFVAKI